MEPIIALWIVCGIAACFVAHNHGASAVLWLFVGFVFGPIGFLMSFASESARKCPFCWSAVYKEASRCARCQANIGKP
jgi:hypothetical protein